jgi:hypothetical protein
MKSAGLITAVLLSLAWTVSTPLDAQDFILQMPDEVAAPGESFVIDLEGVWAEPIAGYSLSIAFPPNPPLENLDLSVEETLVGEMNPEFVQATIFPLEGEAVLGVLFEITPPFDGIELPVVGFPLALARFTGDVARGAGDQDLAFDYVDGLGDPPINNRFVVETQSVPPDQMSGGVLTISPMPYFIRGDVNMDWQVDVADVIYHLSYTFSGGPLPVCDDAADANNDGHADISDGIYVLTFIFSGGPAPQPPYPDPGPDSVEDDLGCDEPLE